MHFVLMLVVFLAVQVQAETDFSTARHQMMNEIAETVRYTSEYTGKSMLDERVMRHIAKVPRHEFVSTDMRDFAYLNQPLPIAAGQTISQPFIVALMSDLAAIRKDAKVLEVGTGSGYQAAVLAGLAQQVYSIEIIEELAQQATMTLKRLAYTNVTVRTGDGYNGWPEQAPFDAIIVTAAAPTVPEPLIEQLARGGKLVIPVGEQSSVQTLLLIEKDDEGRLSRREILPVGFVPLIRNQ